MSERPNVTVRDDVERHVFLAVLDDGTEAGGAYYRREDGIVTFTHTEVSPEFAGQGVGSALADGALRAVREDGERIVPRCSFMEAYVERHPQYQGLVVD